MRILLFSELNKKMNERNNSLLILFGLICIGFTLRLYYIPYQIPISADGIDYFAYTVAIYKEGYFPIGYLELNFGYQIDATFGHGVDLILDLGEEVIPQQTSIVDLSGEAPVIVREGKGNVDLFR